MESLRLVIVCIFTNLSSGYCNPNYSNSTGKPVYSTPRKENITYPKTLFGGYSKPNRRVKRGK